MSKPIIALCSALALSAAVPAAAQTSGSRLSSVYVGADVGEAQYRDGCDLVANCDDKDTSWGIFAGYQFIPNLAAEVAFRDLGSISAPGGSVDGEAIELVGVGRIPITERFAAYGKLGGYRGELEGRGNNETNSDLTYGLGLEFDFTRNLGIRGEWQRYPGMGGGDFGDETDVDVIRVGALFRFQ